MCLLYYSSELCIDSLSLSQRTDRGEFARATLDGCSGYFLAVVYRRPTLLRWNFPADQWGYMLPSAPHRRKVDNAMDALKRVGFNGFGFMIRPRGDKRRHTSRKRGWTKKRSFKLKRNSLGTTAEELEILFYRLAGWWRECDDDERIITNRRTEATEGGGGRRRVEEVEVVVEVKQELGSRVMDECR